MALVVLCGIPAAGKSRRAHELAGYLRGRAGDGAIKDVHIIDDDLLGITKNDYYDRESEKRARGKQMSAVKRLLNPKSVVILDGMSYIKGFRYQLFCEAKAAQVTSCVLYTGTVASTAKQFDETKQPEARWPSDLFDQLVFRFEEPNGMTRWDSPLFIVVPDDELPCDEIWDSLVNKRPHKPNAATLKKAAVGTDYLSTLNDTTSKIVKEVLELHSVNPGGQVVLCGRRTELPYNLTLPQLTRIRRNFVSLNRQTAMPLENIQSYFIEFLEQNWNLTA